MLNSLYKLYYQLPLDNSLGKLTKLGNRIYAKLLMRLLNKYAVDKFRKEQTSHPVLEPDLEKKARRCIVSLTSFPARIDSVWISIETLMRQTQKPDMIILWLSELQFPNKEADLPETLINLQKRGLTIRFCEDDLRSHKKYYYALREFPEDIVILVDDDLFYEENVLASLLDAHKRNPKDIIAIRAHKWTYDKNGKLMPYKRWKRNYVKIKEDENDRLFFTSGFGTLLPPQCMPEEVLNKEAFMKLSPAADDVWLNVCAIVKNTKVINIPFYNKDGLTVGSTQNQTLAMTNVREGGNDRQIIDVCNYFNRADIYGQKSF